MAALTRNCPACGQPMVIRTRTRNRSFLACAEQRRCGYREELPEWFRLRAQGAPELPLEGIGEERDGGG